MVVLHAKALVVDDEVVFITSANLTESALERHIELGLLVRDHALAASTSTHVRGLIDRGLLRPLQQEWLYRQPSLLPWSRATSRMTRPATNVAERSEPAGIFPLAFTRCVRPQGAI